MTYDIMMSWRHGIINKEVENFIMSSYFRFFLITDLTVIQHQLKKCLSKKYKNFLSSDWLPVEDAQYFSFREFYVPIMLEEKIQTPEGAQRGKSVPSLTNAIQEIMQDKTENYTLLMEGIEMMF